MTEMIGHPHPRASLRTDQSHHFCQNTGTRRLAENDWVPRDHLFLALRCLGRQIHLQKRYVERYHVSLQSPDLHEAAFGHNLNDPSHCMA